MRCNVEILKLIQLGITLVNEEGQVAQDITWQFNFYFNTEYVVSLGLCLVVADNSLD